MKVGDKFIPKDNPDGSEILEIVQLVKVNNEVKYKVAYNGESSKGFLSKYILKTKWLTYTEITITVAPEENNRFEDIE